MRILLVCVIFLGLFIILYALAVYILPKIAIEKEKNKSKDIDIYIILINGKHTDIVVPVSNACIDWPTEIKFENTKANDPSARFLAIGWGDKGFYLETPTWADLKYSTAFKAAFWLSSSAIHATFYNQMKEGDDCKKIIISTEQYVRLIDYIQNSFDRDANGKIINIKTTANYSDYDAFYEAKGKYSLFYTCNTWANNALKSCGQKACLWTPLDKGIFYQYK